MKDCTIPSTHRLRATVPVAMLAFTAVTLGAAIGCGVTASTPDGSERPATAGAAASKELTSLALVEDGQRVFRLETFGDEQLWTDTLRLNEVVEKNLDPTTALKVGLKVDADALPAGILAKVDLKSPATTVALLKMNAVVGLQATVDANDHITRLGVTCALCHSTVDNSVMPGIGHRKDGWPNRDLERRGDHCVVASAVCRQESGLRFVGSRQIRPPVQPGREEHAARRPAGVRVGPSQERNVHGRGADLLLECVRRGDADGWTRQLRGPTARDRRQAFARHGELQAPGLARVPAQSAGASTSGRKLRCRDRRARTHRV